MKIKTKLLSFFLISLSLLVLSGCGCKKTEVKRLNLQLEVWGLFDDSEIYDEIFSQYTKLNPNVTEIKYRKMSPETYRQDVLEALASGQGPDIILIHNTWLPSFKDKLAPAPAEVLGEKKYRSDFVDVAAQDFISESQVYAVPLSVDSLSLYYNKDFFNEAGITAPPSTWQEFIEDSKKITKIDQFGQISVAGGAMGTAYNINRSTDILNLLLLQNGLNLSERNASGMSQESIAGLAGENVVSFYTQFAKASSSAYSWNPRMHYSIDAFAEGKLGMMFNYSWQIETLKSKSPKLNFAIAPIPQIQGRSKVNYANYWGYGVVKNKSVTVNASDPNVAGVVDTPAAREARVAEAWTLLKFMSAVPEVVIGDSQATATTVPYDAGKIYIEKTRKPSARRDLIEVQKNDSEVGVFAVQNLFSKSFYQTDPSAIEGILAEMIDSVNKGSSTVSEAVKAASAKINQVMVKK